jgi:hypothetical protein
MQELDRRIKDGTDRMASTLHFWVSEDLRVLWENGLEIARRVAGSEISPTEAFEYMVAEFIATWSNGGSAEAEEKDDSPVPDAHPAEAEPAPEPLFPFANPLPLPFDPCELALGPEPKTPFDRQFKTLVLDRDHWRCTYPGCSARSELHVHHIQFRSRCGPHELWNGTTRCAFHHGLVHAEPIAVKGRAPHPLAWTPPKLLREVLERKRNRRPLWAGELEVREFPHEMPEELVAT